ncbi:MAG TPA: hypothetical protein VNT31_10000 [Nocardioides sp.]|nr:hypothetical protein [Nocardioides sp.]
MPIELTAAVLLVALAFLCAGWVARSGDAVPMPGMGPTIGDGVPAGPAADEWRSAALRHFHEHQDLQRSVAQALATPGAVSGRARGELLVALGAPRVDQYA